MTNFTQYDAAHGVLEWWAEESVDNEDYNALAKLLSAVTGEGFNVEQAEMLAEYAKVHREVGLGLADPEDYAGFGHDPSAALDYWENAAYDVLHQHFCR